MSRKTYIKGLKKISENEMNEMIRKEKAAYYREWRQKNPEKAAEIQRRYWERKAMERMEREQREKDGDQQNHGQAG